MGHLTDFEAADTMLRSDHAYEFEKWLKTNPGTEEGRRRVERMQVDALQHLVLTVSDTEATIAFYSSVLGMRAVTFAEGRRALVFGVQKLNLHAAGHEYEPKAAAPTPGSADLCLLTSEPLKQVQEHLQVCGVTVEEGPV
jgi:predicted enzyme related to lactoylglutathione lyase